MLFVVFDNIITAFRSGVSSVCQSERVVIIFIPHSYRSHLLLFLPMTVSGH